MGNYFCRLPFLATPFAKSPMQKGERRRRFLESDQLILDSSAVFRLLVFPGQSCRRGKARLESAAAAAVPPSRKCRRVPSSAVMCLLCLDGAKRERGRQGRKALFPLPRPPSQPVALLLLSLLPSSVKVRAGANAHTRNPRARFAR